MTRSGVHSNKHYTWSCNQGHNPENVGCRYDMGVACRTYYSKKVTARITIGLVVSSCCHGQF